MDGRAEAQCRACVQLLSVTMVSVHPGLFFFFLAVTELFIFASTGPSNAVLLVRAGVCVCVCACVRVCVRACVRACD